MNVFLGVGGGGWGGVVNSERDFAHKYILRVTNCHSTKLIVCITSQQTPTAQFPSHFYAFYVHSIAV